MGHTRHPRCACIPQSGTQENMQAPNTSHTQRFPDRIHRHKQNHYTLLPQSTQEARSPVPHTAHTRCRPHQNTQRRKTRQNTAACCMARIECRSRGRNRWRTRSCIPWSRCITLCQDRLSKASTLHHVLTQAHNHPNNSPACTKAMCITRIPWAGQVKG